MANIPMVPNPMDKAGEIDILKKLATLPKILPINTIRKRKILNITPSVSEIGNNKEFASMGCWIAWVPKYILRKILHI